MLFYDIKCQKWESQQYANIEAIYGISNIILL